MQERYLKAPKCDRISQFKVGESHEKH
jgi:hypothetical protein